MGKLKELYWGFVESYTPQEITFMGWFIHNWCIITLTNIFQGGLF